MTDTWAAKVLEGVPRLDYSSDVDLGLLQPKEDGSFIPYADALAAIARMGAGDGLVERATAARDNLMVLSDTKSWLATTAIDDLLAHIAALTAQVAELNRRAIRAADARAEALLQRAAQMAYEVWDDPEALSNAILALIPETKP